MSNGVELSRAFRAGQLALLLVVLLCACGKKEEPTVAHQPVAVPAVVADQTPEPTAAAPKPIIAASGATHPESISLGEDKRLAMQRAIEEQQAMNKSISGGGWGASHQAALHAKKSASKNHEATQPTSAAAGASTAPAPVPLPPPPPPPSNQVPVTAGVAYDVPNEMVQGAATAVNLWIDPHKDSDQVQQALRDYLTSADMRAKGSEARRTSQAQRDAAAVQGTTLPLVHIYKAALKSADGNFSIALLGPDQITPNLDSKEPMAWVWEVTPLKPAEAMDLVLSVTEVVQNGASQSERPFRPPMLVHVKVRSSANWMQQAIDFLGQFKALIAALTGVVAAAGALWLGIKKFGSKDGEDKPKT